MLSIGNRKSVVSRGDNLAARHEAVSTSRASCGATRGNRAELPTASSAWASNRCAASRYSALLRCMRVPRPHFPG
eukprot:6180570-Pleurochrysis_carterae.AAC.5